MKPYNRTIFYSLSILLFLTAASAIIGTSYYVILNQTPYVLSLTDPCSTLTSSTCASISATYIEPVKVGDPVYISWSSFKDTGPNSGAVALNGPDYNGFVVGTGQIAIYPSTVGSQVYTLTVDNGQGTIRTDTVSIQVNISSPTSTFSTLQGALKSSEPSSSPSPSPSTYKSSYNAEMVLSPTPSPSTSKSSTTGLNTTYTLSTPSGKVYGPSPISINASPASEIIESTGLRYTPLPSNTGTSGSSSNNSVTTYTDNRGSTDNTNTSQSRSIQGSHEYTCVKNILGKDFVWFNTHRVGKNQIETQKIAILEQKTATCRATLVPVKRLSDSEIAKLPPYEKCVVESIGIDRYQFVTDNKEALTLAETTASKHCLESVNEMKPAITYYVGTELPASMTTCLEENFGKDVLQKLSQNTTVLSNEQKAKGAACFMSSSSDAYIPPIMQTDIRTVACLASALPGMNLTKVRNGQAKLTDKQRQDAQKCFETINPIQQVLLPPPPDSVPLADVKPDQLQVIKAENYVQPLDQDKKVSTIQFTGRALPNTSIYLYFFSDPTVVTVKTDANGNWSYNLHLPLEKGQHSAYVAVRDENNSVVRSEVFTFSVAQAAGGGNVQSGLVLSQTNFQSQLRQYITVFIIILLAGVCAVIGMFLYKKKQSKASHLMEI